MRAVSLMYHDVVERGEYDSSGFSGVEAAAYKLEPAVFRNHIDAIAQAIRQAPAHILESPFDRSTVPFFITFDDGGISAYETVANQLEMIGWRGHFFITTGYLGSPGFLSGSHIRELKDRGHIIGSHSSSHPTRMSHCTWSELLNEWSSSVGVLSDVLGDRVRVASLPGGYYSREVAEAAALNGIDFLFTSEPTTRCISVDGCLVLGRYAIQRHTRPQTAAAIASGRPIPQISELLLWNFKKYAKAAGGRRFLKPIESLLYRRSAAVDNTSGNKGSTL